MAGEPRDLVALSKARQHLAVCTSIDEVKDIRDKAEAVRAYAKKAGMSLDVQNSAATVKLLAERRAGELLRGMEKHEGGRPSENRSHGETGLRLSDLGLTKTQSHRWQTIAELSENEIEAFSAEASKAHKELTSGKVYKVAKQRKAKEKVNGHAVLEGVVDDLNMLISEGKSFTTIYADPPWRYGNQGTRAATDNHYDTMTVAQICAEPVVKLATDDARLFLWTTTSFLRESFDVIDAWGFEYKSQVIWCKPQMGIGNYCRVSHEILMIAAKKGPWDERDKNIKSWLVEPRGKHSKKPDAFRRIVERLSPGPYLEMYGREAKDGWTTYGNQVSAALFGT